MDRKSFINQITGGLTLTCISCMMQACSKEEGTTPPNNNNNNNNNNTTPPTNVLLTVNLSSQLLLVNDFILDNGVIVVRTATGNTVTSFVAFSSACPHAGATINFVKSSSSFNCSAHGSNFSINGSVTNGPAASALEKKTIEITGTTLNVK
ncbi:MAG: ubiquinol-cytochrome c reductase iron-sulfur subunit [Bacteroidota bacterium]|nr:Rieske (2Fe-2S) protein [Chitinophagaceae bacterium]MCE2758032.1 Rieske (2Fe-2S) protein [Chitinophagaceae bacterium]